MSAVSQQFGWFNKTILVLTYLFSFSTLAPTCALMIASTHWFYAKGSYKLAAEFGLLSFAGTLWTVSAGVLLYRTLSVKTQNRLFPVSFTVLGMLGWIIWVLLEKDFDLSSSSVRSTVYPILYSVALILIASRRSVLTSPNVSLQRTH